LNINPFDILKNAQKIQEQMGTLQEKLSAVTATGSAGGGMVELDLNGKMECLDVRIAAEAVDPQDVSMLEDLISAAHANALEKIREALNREMGALAGGMGIPNIPGMFPGFGPGAS
jgi:DNA-binding YbaB/EbfC family protein